MLRVNSLFWSGVLSVAIFCGSWITAEAELVELVCGEKVSEPEAVLRRVQSEHEKVRALQATFIQESYLASLEVSETSSGDTWFRKPGVMKWWYRKPEEQQFLLRDSKIWIYQPVDKQVVVEQLGAVLLSELPVAFLMGVGSLGEAFTLDGGCKTKGGVLLSLLPRRTGDGLARFQLLVDPVKGMPRGAQVVDDSGNRTSIYFTTFEVNPEIPADTFEPRFPAGVDVDDRG